MQVSVHEAVQEDHPTHGSHAYGDDAVHPNPRRLELRFVHPFNELHRQHRIETRCREQTGKAYLGLVGEVLRKTPIVLGLIGQVNFLLHGISE